MILGASTFPFQDGLDNPTFARSASLARDLFAAPGPVFRETAVLDLFDTDHTPNAIIDAIEAHLDAHPGLSDLLNYYCGHGSFQKDRTYFLMLKGTRAGREASTGFTLRAVRHDLEARLSRLRLYLVLDCCYAGAGVDAMMGPDVSPAVETAMHEALPAGGWVVLCASSRSVPAMAPAGHDHTMFTGALARALRTADRRRSLDDLVEDTRQIILRTHGPAAVLPECHAPRQLSGDLRRVKLFGGRVAAPETDHIEENRVEDASAKQTHVPAPAIVEDRQIVVAAELPAVPAAAPAVAAPVPTDVPGPSGHAVPIDPVSTAHPPIHPAIAALPDPETMSLQELFAYARDLTARAKKAKEDAAGKPTIETKAGARDPAGDFSAGAAITPVNPPPVPLFGSLQHVIRRAAGLAKAQTSAGPALFKRAHAYLRTDEGSRRDSEAAQIFRLSSRAAKSGDLNAECVLGLCYMEGIGVPANVYRGVEIIRHAADRGNPFGQMALAQCYEGAIGMEVAGAIGMKVDSREARCEAWRLYCLAARQGYAEAQYELGERYMNGTGILPKDEHEAVSWYRLSANQGYDPAQEQLGYCYLNGIGVTADPAEGLRWCRLAADQGNDWAYYSIGRCYLTGHGVAKDVGEAVSWFRLAARQGNTQAQERLAQLERT